MAYRFRLYPDPGQIETMIRHCRDARYVWNLALEQRNYWSQHRGRPLPPLSVYDQKRDLTVARQHTWLSEGSSVVQQQALFDLDQAFKNWWSNPGHFRRPTWRKHGVNEGFAVRDLTVAKLNRRWATVVVPKVGPVRFRLTRDIAVLASCRSARVTLDRAGRWHVSFASPQPAVPRTPTGAAVGVDVGVTNTVATSDGHLDTVPGLTPGETARKRRLQRQMARQQKGSNRRARTRAALARIAARETDRRKDWIEQTTTRLVRGYDLVAVEDLPVAAMTRRAAPKPDPDRPGRHLPNGANAKTGLNRSIRNSGWGQFRARLEAKAAAAVTADGHPCPVRVVAVNPAYTSQRCAACGHTAPDNRESQAVFGCVACGHQAHADTNAAVNIRAAGLAVPGRGAIPSRTRPPGRTGNEASTTSRPAAA